MISVFSVRTADMNAQRVKVVTVRNSAAAATSHQHRSVLHVTSLLTVFRRQLRTRLFWQFASDVLRICAYMYTMSRESSSLCEKFDVYIGNFGGNNAKRKIQNAVLNKFKVLCSVGR